MFQRPQKLVVGQVGEDGVPPCQPDLQTTVMMLRQRRVLTGATV